MSIDHSLFYQMGNNANELLEIGASLFYHLAYFEEFVLSLLLITKPSALKMVLSVGNELDLSILSIKFLTLDL